MDAVNPQLSALNLSFTLLTMPALHVVFLLPLPTLTFLYEQFLCLIQQKFLPDWQSKARRRFVTTDERRKTESRKSIGTSYSKHWWYCLLARLSGVTSLANRRTCGSDTQTTGWQLQSIPSTWSFFFLFLVGSRFESVTSDRDQVLVLFHSLQRTGFIWFEWKCWRCRTKWLLSPSMH